jgi:hypothetical protein
MEGFGFASVGNIGEISALVSTSDSKPDAHILEILKPLISACENPPALSRTLDLVKWGTLSFYWLRSRSILIEDLPRELARARKIVGFMKKEKEMKQISFLANLRARECFGGSDKAWKTYVALEIGESKRQYGPFTI